MAGTKKIIDFTNPDYRGIWVYKSDFALFSIWLEKGYPQTLIGASGKCFEKYKGPLIESTIYDLKEDKSGIFFRKEYNRPRADLLRGIIHYRGQRKNEFELFRGVWTSLNSDKEEVQGPFFLADNFENMKMLREELSNLHISKFEKELEDLQREFPFTPLI